MPSRNDQPRISLNKLAEFMTARKPARRRSILKDQKFPTEYKGMYHREACEAIASCIASNLETVSALDRAVALLEQQSPEKIGTQRRLTQNADAIERFKTMLDGLDLKGATPRLGETSQPKLAVHNVNISVRPEIILTGRGKSGPLAGAMKIHFPTTNPLDDEAGAYVSAVLQEWAKAFLADEGEIYAPYCFVIDVGQAKIHSGVKATTARMKDVESACREIFALWPSITQDD